MACGEPASTPHYCFNQSAFPSYSICLRSTIQRLAKMDALSVVLFSLGSIREHVLYGCLASETDRL